MTGDCVLLSDGGDKARAARHPIVGAARVARFVRKLAPLWAGAAKLVTINGEPGFIVEQPRGLFMAGTIVVRDGRIAALHWVRNPDKLR